MATGENTFQAIRSICDAANTTDKVVTAVRELADANVADFGDYARQLQVLDIIRTLAEERLGANDIDWDADGALGAVVNLTTNVLKDRS